MDEKTKELIKNVCEEWIEANSIMKKLNPKIEGLELLEATRTVVEQSNKFKISAHISQSRKNGESKYQGRQTGDGMGLATDRQKKYLQWKKIPYTASLTSKQASELISRDKAKGGGTDKGDKPEDRGGEFF